MDNIYIRNGDGHLCKVIFQTQTFYHVERVKDRIKMDVPRHSASIIKTLESFPGDWAIQANQL